MEDIGSIETYGALPIFLKGPMVDEMKGGTNSGTAKGII